MLVYRAAMSSATAHLPERADEKFYIYVRPKFKVETIKECLNMREMLETCHLSALMGGGKPPVNL